MSNQNGIEVGGTVMTLHDPRYGLYIWIMDAQNYRNFCPKVFDFC